MRLLRGWGHGSAVGGARAQGQSRYAMEASVSQRLKLEEIAGIMLGPAAQIAKAT